MSYDRTVLALELMPSMLQRIEVNLRWAFFDGYQSTKAAATQPSVTNGLPPEFRDAWLGNAQARQVYLDAVHRLAVAEVRIAYCIEVAEPRTAQPALQKPYRAPHDLYRAVRTAAALRLRCRQLSRALPSGTEQLRSEGRFRAIGRQVLGPCIDTARLSAYQCVNTADLDLAALLSPGEEGTSSLEVCRVCSLNPVDDNDKKQQRCEACARYWYRNGVERPKYLHGNANPLAVVLEAQARREARGEGYGHS